MNYNLFRFLETLVLVIIFVLIIFILKKKKIIFLFYSKNSNIYYRYKSEKKFRIKLLITYLSITISVLLIVLIARYPIEGYFINFSSLKDTFEYSGIEIDNKNIKVFNYEDCVFAVDTSKNEIYTVTITDNKYGLVNFNSSDIEYDLINGTYNFCNISVAKYNKDSNKTFYYLILSTDKIDADVQIDYSDMNCISSRNVSIPSNNLLKNKSISYEGLYTYIENDIPKKKFHINCDYQEGDFAKLPYIRGINDK